MVSREIGQRHNYDDFLALHIMSKLLVTDLVIEVKHIYMYIGVIVCLSSL